MRGVVTLLVLAAFAVAGAWYIQHLAGHVALTVMGTTVEAPVSVAILALLLFSLALWLLFRAISWLVGLRHAARRLGGSRSRRRGDDAVTATLVALAARDAAAARKHAATARRQLGDTPQTLLLAAYAASLADDDEAAETAYRALAARKDGAFLGLRGLMSLAIRHADWPRANDLARDAERAYPNAAWVKGERAGLAVRTGDWHEALLLNRDAPPHAALAAAAAHAEQDPVKALKLAKEAYKRDPALPAAALEYARRLRNENREKLAQDVLRQAWARCPQPDIAALALAPAPDRVARLQAGRDLVQSAPESAESHLLLGRLALEAGQPEEARRHADAASRAGLKQRRLHLLFADIASAGGQDDAHRAAHEQALRQAAEAEPDPAWICEACNTRHPTWSPVCPSCHTLARIHWVAPGVAAA